VETWSTPSQQHRYVYMLPRCVQRLCGTKMLTCAVWRGKP